MMRVCTLATFLDLLLVVSFAASQETPVRYNATVLQGGGEGCPPDELREAARANISEDIRVVLQGVQLGVGGYSPSGCSGSGWTRIAYLNMNDSTQQCPTNWTLISSPIRTCGRSTGTSCSSTSVPCTCDSAIFSNNQGIRYSQVCGRIIGYRVGDPEGFGVYTHLRGNIDRAYAEGVSITHGNPRQHIWTFATAQGDGNCPCGGSISSPSFVGNDYFCEVGDPPAVSDFYLNDPLWDGEGCASGRVCCTFNNPPWFQKTLPLPTTNSIEARLCGDYFISDENFPIQLIEIYVK